MQPIEARHVNIEHFLLADVKSKDLHKDVAEALHVEYLSDAQHPDPIRAYWNIVRLPL